MLGKNDIEILNTIYKNSRMAYDCTKQVLAKSADTELNDYLKRQMKHYARNCIDVKNTLAKEGHTARPVPAMQSAMAAMGISMKTMRDHTVGNIAELMYNGTNMGIVDIARSVNHSRNASQDTVRNAETLLSEEEKYADGLKKFL